MLCSVLHSAVPASTTPSHRRLCLDRYTMLRYCGNRVQGCECYCGINSVQALAQFESTESVCDNYCGTLEPLTYDCCAWENGCIMRINYPPPSPDPPPPPPPPPSPPPPSPSPPPPPSPRPNPPGTKASPGPSPPPPSPSPPSTDQPSETIVFELLASGSVGDYSDISGLQQSIATAAGVDKSLVTIQVAAASVMITATIAVPAAKTATAVYAVLSSSLGTGSAADVSAALGISVEQSRLSTSIYCNSVQKCDATTSPPLMCNYDDTTSGSCQACEDAATTQKCQLNAFPTPEGEAECKAVCVTNPPSPPSTPPGICVDDDDALAATLGFDDGVSCERLIRTQAGACETSASICCHSCASPPPPPTDPPPLPSTPPRAPSTSTSGVPVYVYAAGGGGGFVLLIIIVVVVVRYKKKLAKVHASINEELDPKKPIPDSINEPGAWHFFISHTQRDGDAKLIATELWAGFKDCFKAECWLDVKLPTRDMAAMKEGIRNSDTCICIITNNGGKDTSYFSRPMCRQEVMWAVLEKKKIVPVVKIDDKSRIGDFIAARPQSTRTTGNWRRRTPTRSSWRGPTLEL